MSVLFSKILSKYLRMIVGSERRLNIARKYKCHEVVVEVSIHVVLGLLKFAMNVNWWTFHFGHQYIRYSVPVNFIKALNFNNYCQFNDWENLYHSSLQFMLSPCHCIYISWGLEYTCAYNCTWQCTCITRQFDILTNAFNYHKYW